MRHFLALLSPWMLRGFVVAIIASTVFAWPFLPSMAAILALFFLSRVGPRPVVDPTPRPCLAPLTGPWVGFNSPADKVPSHGTHAYGQTFAIDVVGPSGSDEPRRMGLDWVARRPEAYDAFGREVVAAADGTVVRTLDVMRDHRSRASLWPILGMMLGGFFRELGGVSFLLGNHVVIDHGDGTWSAYAHLQRGSVAVQKGQRVLAGQPIGSVGNSGNSSEPHLHFHLMDHANPYVGRGVPFIWTNIQQQTNDLDLGTTWGQDVNGTVTAGVPAAAQRFTASGSSA